VSIKAIRRNEVNTMNELVEVSKIRLQVTVREEMVQWIDQQVEKLRFATRSHAIEYALAKLIESEEEKGSE
jgi:Arc/MetJ-type ribon-helix-helix transcriptional regulator